MKYYSLQFKLSVMIVLGFFVTSCLVLLIVQHQMTQVLNTSQEAEYGQRLQTILRGLDSYYQRLQRTGMVETYQEDFQQRALAQMQKTQAGSRQQAKFFVLNQQGQFLISPFGEIRGQARDQARRLPAMQQQTAPSFTFVDPQLGELWSVSKVFEPWGWTLGFWVPIVEKYALVNQLNHSLLLVFGGVTLSMVVILLLLARAQLRPITSLSKISAEIAKGRFDHQITIDRPDEIGRLANNFKQMQSAIQQTIASLRSSEENLRTTLDSIGDAVIATDAQGLIVRMNPVAEDLTGWPSVQAIGRPLPEVFHIIHYRTRELLPCPAQQVLGLQERIELPADTVLIARSGKEYQIADSAAPIRRENQQLSGVVLVFRDITQEMILQEQLLQSRKMDTIGQLAGGVAHDFNNMLGGILGAAELLKRRLSPDEKNQKYVGMIVDAAQRAADLTSKLLTFARKQHISSTPVDVHLALNKAFELLQNTVDRRIRIHIALNAPHSMVAGDLSQLQNAFLNLGLNAAQAMPAGGDLHFSTQIQQLDTEYCARSSFELQPGLFLEIEIRDSGQGILPENLERIFEPFFTTKEQGKGTGLGLAAVFGTVQMHHGAITAYSEPGHGSVFHLLLPLSDAPHTAVIAPPALLCGSGRILVIDDEHVMRATAEAILVDLGYTVVLAENGRIGLEYYRRHHSEIDLVLLDMIMPEMNGRDCFLGMKAINPKVKVILSSGFSRSEELTDMRIQGLCGFIQKPYRSITLSRVVAGALKGAANHADMWQG